MPRKRQQLVPQIAIAGAIGLLAAALLAGVLVAMHPSPTPTLDPQAAPRPASRWRFIVVHHSASPNGNASVFDDWHRKKGWRRLGYHFVIGNGSGSGDGQVETGSRWLDQASGAHCLTDSGQFNKHGIGICLVGNFELARPTPAQLAALDELIARLCLEHSIAPENVLGHKEALARERQARTTACPGKLMDMNGVRRRARR